MNRLAEAIQKLLGHAITMTKDPVIAKELLQDLAVKVFTRPEYYIDKPDEDLGRLLYFNMRNIYIDRLRWERRNLVKELPPNYHYRTVENDAWDIMRKKEVLNALQTMSNEKHKLCFRLRLESNVAEFEDMLPYKKNEINQGIEYAKRHIKKALQL